MSRSSSQPREPVLRDVQIALRVRRTADPELGVALWFPALALALSACGPALLDAAVQDAAEGPPVSADESDSALRTAPSFVLAPVGCPMAHCSPNMSDQVGMAVPEGAVAMRWSDGDPHGKNVGVGCSGNGTVVACAYTGSPSGTRLVVYRGDGSRVFAAQSQDLLSDAWTSTPLVGADGSIIAVDQANLVRFSPQGRVVLKVPHGGGTPISPVIVEAKYLLLAKRGGAITLHRLSDLSVLASLRVERPEDSGTVCSFDTINTPGVMGSRAYVALQHTCEPTVGRLSALIVDGANPDATKRLRMAWSHSFTAPSGGSPLVVLQTLPSGRRPVVYFDGAASPQSAGPFFAGIADVGPSGQLLFEKPLTKPAAASAAQDPRGGVWTYAFGEKYLYRFDGVTGQVLDTVDVDLTVSAPGTHKLTGVISVALRAATSAPVLMFPATALDGPNPSTYVVALDATTRTALWRIPVLPGGLKNGNPGQFPVVTGPAGTPVVAFAAKSLGAMGIGL